MRKRVAIIILNWNGCLDTIDCVQSLQEVECSMFDIVIVDNASTDRSAEILKQRFPECKLVQNDRNLGFSGGYNVGIKYALTHDFKYILLLNNDTVVEKNFIFPLIEKLENNEAIGVVQSKLINYYDHNKIDSLGQEILAAGGMRDIINDGLSTKSHRRSIEIFGACAAAALYRAEVFSEVGLFDESFFILFEDADLSWRIRLKGYKIFLVPDSIVYHKRGISGGHRWNKIRNYYLRRNNLFLLVKYWPNNYFIKYIHFILYSLIRNSINAALKGEFQLFLNYLNRKIKERTFIQKNPNIKRLYSKWLH